MQFPRQNIRDTDKMLRKIIVYFKKIYNFGLEPFFIGVSYIFRLLIKNMTKNF